MKIWKRDTSCLYLHPFTLTASRFFRAPAHCRSISLTISLPGTLDNIIQLWQWLPEVEIFTHYRNLEGHGLLWSKSEPKETLWAMCSISGWPWLPFDEPWRTRGSGSHNGTGCYIGSMSVSCFSTQLGQKSPRQMKSVELEGRLIKICALSSWQNISQNPQELMMWTLTM